MHTFRDEEAPLAATDLRGADVRALLAARDGREWHSDPTHRDPERAADTRDGVVLRFRRPADAHRMKLRVAARNTWWAAEMMYTVLAGQGVGLPAWFARMNNDAQARAQLNDFLEREGMLHVQVHTRAGWVTRGLFWAAGPEVVKEEAFDLPIDDAAGPDLEVRLETAVDFWSVDAVAASFGPDEPVTVRELAASEAHTSAGRDVTALFANADGRRFDTVRGDVAELTFDAPPPAPATERSFVLVSRGYYIPDVQPAKDADPEALAALMAVPGAASRLSLELLLARARPQ
jgi:hypothetical protein